MTTYSFETGDFTGWTVESTSEPFIPWIVMGGEFEELEEIGEFGIGFPDPQDGDFVALNGFDGGGPMTFSMYQDFTVCSCSELNWKDRIQWSFEEGSFASEPRIYKVQLRDPNTNEVITTLYEFSTGTEDVNPTGDTGWQTHNANLSDYQGTTVRLYFLEIIPQSFTGPAQIEFDAISIDSSLDSDGDGVCNDIDPYPYSNLSETLMIDRCSTGVENIFITDGTTMADLIDDLIDEANEAYDGDNWDRVHKNFVRKVNHLTYYWRKDRLISWRERSKISRCAWGSSIPYQEEIPR